MSAPLAGARSAVRGLNPACFAMVMATGIVAIASDLEGMPLVARALAVLNVVAFVALAALTLARVIFYGREFLRDLSDHTRGVGFFTTVAATAVLGAQLVVIFARYQAALALWLVSGVLWAGFTYAIFTALTIKEQKPSLGEGINGGWLIAVVATQAVADLGVLLLPQLGPYRHLVLFLALSLWLCGGMLYIWMISLVFYRYTFFQFSPSDLMPPYWINMGAMAISTVVGALLVRNASGDALLEGLVPFVTGFTVLFWATATWWIPMLVILGVWRHVVKRFPLTYDPLYWGAVFPLGMYAVATYRLAEVTGQPFLFSIARDFLYVALAAWLAAFAGLAGSLSAWLKPERAPHGASV
ncbi:MAG TPA: tellurite resistance/C4-dicarboxylate transporter family protein [Bryobacterales bacterium]|nr:tellurite resistance/C4-dicarboxylate transporter family protein [Bryobacterales bacterium]